MQVRRLVIAGLVQGVGFRYAMMAQARLLNVNGWVRNRRDGSVEAMVAGDARQIDEMLAWSRIGPAGAVVEHCDRGDRQWRIHRIRPVADNVIQADWL